MLPTYTPLADERRPSPKSGFGRAWVRWVALCCFLSGFLWLAYPYAVLFGSEVRPSGVPPHYPEMPPPPTKGPSSFPNDTLPSIWKARAEGVRGAYVHAMAGYNAHAFPNDELLSVTGGNSNKFNGWAVTLLDSLDTMWLMGLHEDFADAIQVVANQTFVVMDTGYAPFFETVIRYLGGLLSAYALSGNTVLLARADALGQMLLPAFNATASGLPAYSVNTQTGETRYGWMGNAILFAEAATCQLEFKYLAKLTGRAEYYEAVENVMTKLYEADVDDGLFAETWSENAKPLNTHYTVGASADSGYEYLLKQWLLSGDAKARDQYLKSVNGIMKKLLYITPNRKLLYVTDTRDGYITHRMEHLACFLPGVLALGAHTLDLSPRDKELHQWAALGLAYTCWVSYADQLSGLGPDQLQMVAGGEKWLDHIEQWEASGREGGIPPGSREVEAAGNGPRDYINSQDIYLLRPETVESLYIMWKTTGDPQWRERGYSIYTALENRAKTPYGYSSLSRIDHLPPMQTDDMPSYFLAETLKYLYLLFDDNDPISLDKWVFNTEAHPIPIFEWSKWEKARYNIKP